MDFREKVPTVLIDLLVLRSVYSVLRKEAELEDTTAKRNRADDC